MEYALIEMMAMEFLQMTEMKKKKQISDEDYAEIRETVSEIKQKLDFLPAALKSHEAFCLEKIRKINTVRHALYETGDQDIIDSLESAIDAERHEWIQELRETRKRLRERSRPENKKTARMHEHPRRQTYETISIIPKSKGESKWILKRSGGI